MCFRFEGVTKTLINGYCYAKNAFYLYCLEIKIRMKYI